MAKIQVGLRPVVGDIHLAVLEGVHGAGVHINVRVQLLKGDGQPAALKQGADGGGGQPFAQGRKNAAGDKNELGAMGLIGSLHKMAPVS